jgi:hypothetical protein
MFSAHLRTARIPHAAAYRSSIVTEPCLNAPIDKICATVRNVLAQAGLSSCGNFPKKETYTSWQIKIRAKVVNRAAKAASKAVKVASKAAADNRSLDNSKVVSKVAAAKSLVSNSKSPERAASRNPKESSTSEPAFPPVCRGFSFVPGGEGPALLKNRTPVRGSTAPLLYVIFCKSVADPMIVVPAFHNPHVRKELHACFVVCVLCRVI